MTLGRPPEPQTLPHQDLADPSLPLQLALAYVEERAGFRPTKHAPDVAVRYWERPDHSAGWCLVPEDIERAAFRAVEDARGEARRRAQWRGQELTKSFTTRRILGLSVCQ